MPYLTVLKVALFLICACAAGWLVFSLAAGFVLYCSSFTTDLAGLQPKGLTKTEGQTPLYAHTKDPRIMNPINEGKERWQKRRDAGFIETLSLKARDGITLAGFYWRAESPREDERAPTVLISHGMMDSSIGMGYLAEEYHARGWDVLSVDLRAHGESEGTRRTMGVREGEDLGSWVDLLESRFGARRIFVHGVSMGAASALLYAALASEVPRSVRGIIADSAYASHLEVFVRLLGFAVGNRVIAKSLALGASFTSFVFTGIRFGRAAPARYISRVPVPILFFHGQCDALVPIGMVRPMFSASLKPGSESVVIPEAPHIGPYFFARNLYMQKIDEFYRRTT
ncbi:MAG TPA: alpha/beta hydrolase [Treponemataceae bacterium]|nr:alpha/beta hydrolase [Treponemataceae bacterium]